MIVEVKMLPDRSSEIEHYNTSECEILKRQMSVCGVIFIISVIALAVSMYYEIHELTIVSALAAVVSLSSTCNPDIHKITVQHEKERIMNLTIYEEFRQHYNHYAEEPSERRAMVAYNAWKKSPDIPFSRGDLARKFAADGIPVFVKWQEGQSVTGIDDVSD